MNLRFFVIVMLLLLWSLPTEAQAREERLALLIANQQGWQNEPRLEYVISGDLQPLANNLRALGFRVKILKNQNAATVRKTFAQTRRFLKKNPHIQTFLFYYSGHADQQYFHLGPSKKNPLDYKEFAQFFSKLPMARKIAIFDSCYSGEVIRRFGSLERYRRLLKKGKAKGIRRRRRIDLHRLIMPKQGHEQGIRIIASSLDISWEFREHRASVFTFHLLRGLKGPADVNHDGRITIDELFDYTSQKVMQETGQRPQQLLLLKRSTPYALAPVYRSRLHIGSQVIGKLKVAVANFVWMRKKLRRRPLRLAVVDGPGTVYLERGGTCWRQRLRFPKGGEAQLTQQWTKVPCRRVSGRRKGLLFLEAKPFVPKREPVDASLAFSANFTMTHANLLQSSNWGGGLQLRWGKRWGMGMHFSTGSPEGKSFWLSSLWIRPEFGWTWPFYFGSSSLRLYLSTFARLGMTLQHNAKTTNTILLAGAGAAFDASWWFNRHFGIRFGVQGGFNYTPILQELPFSFQWQLRSALLIGF